MLWGDVRVELVVVVVVVLENYYCNDHVGFGGAAALLLLLMMIPRYYKNSHEYFGTHHLLVLFDDDPLVLPPLNMYTPSCNDVAIDVVIAAAADENDEMGTIPFLDKSLDSLVYLLHVSSPLA